MMEKVSTTTANTSAAPVRFSSAYASTPVATTGWHTSGWNHPVFTSTTPSWTVPPRQMSTTAWFRPASVYVPIGARVAMSVAATGTLAAQSKALSSMARTLHAAPCAMPYAVVPAGVGPLNFSQVIVNVGNAVARAAEGAWVAAREIAAYMNSVVAPAVAAVGALRRAMASVAFNAVVSIVQHLPFCRPTGPPRPSGSVLPGLVPVTENLVAESVWFTPDVAHAPPAPRAVWALPQGAAG